MHKPYWQIEVLECVINCRGKSHDTCWFLLSIVSEESSFKYASLRVQFISSATWEKGVCNMTNGNEIENENEMKMKMKWKKSPGLLLIHQSIVKLYDW